ncbi:two-component system sensor histidine kinase SaeS [Paenibacillus rhizosphaerae]|uniref:histidine kinase n=1 Tax=Paenibacillus rhizosphaerae TaxID=297318 RepID=A0A839TNH2_9BACL|nr:ATP-binding protein [Paenibacillus rhizosphaerae]MBB3128222.1 two-component system sensor histidine kinase SaeS [Paenibacillus rhizosphaerae]
MKLRTWLWLANAISIACIIFLLTAFYRYMLLSMEQFLWLTAATIGAGAASALLHFVLVRPLEASVKRLGEGAGRIAAGDLKARVPQTGLKEFKQLAEQFNHMGSSLEESFRQIRAAESAQRELVANMAHDLRTPLASVQSYAEALEDGVIQDEETFRNYLSTIRSETVRLGELIQDIFELSTLDAGRRGTGAERLSIAEDVLVELLVRFTMPMEAKSLQLKVKLPEQPLRIRIAPQHLERILQNLLENAVRHSPRHGLIMIEAEQTGELDGYMVKFTVSDEGEGIADEEKERVFDRFYRSDRSRSREGGGAGLGLSIAKRMVEQYGGQIGVRDNGLQGSAFWFTVCPDSDRLTACE